MLFLFIKGDAYTRELPALTTPSPTRRSSDTSTGDGLAATGAMTGPHQIPAANGPMLAAMLRSTGCDVDDIGVVGDDLDSIKGAVDAARRHDVILTIGGASVGDRKSVVPGKGV